MQHLAAYAMDTIAEWMRHLALAEEEGKRPAALESMAGPRMSWQGEDESDGWLYGKLVDRYYQEHAEYRFRVEVERVVRETEPAIEREEAPGWVLRTMQDVRPGDTVRMPGQEGTERTVAPQGVLALQHLLHPASTRYNVMPARWGSIEVTFLPPGGGGEPQRYSFAPGMSVEILLAPGEVAAIEMLGWENRVGMIINE